MQNKISVSKLTIDGLFAKTDSKNETEPDESEESIGKAIFKRGPALENLSKEEAVKRVEESNESLRKMLNDLGLND